MQNSQIDNRRRINVYLSQQTTNLNCIHNSPNCTQNTHNSPLKTPCYHANFAKPSSKQPVTYPTTNINCQTIHAIVPKLSDNSRENFKLSDNSRKTARIVWNWQTIQTIQKGTRRFAGAENSPQGQATIKVSCLTIWNTTITIDKSLIKRVIHNCG